VAYESKSSSQSPCLGLAVTSEQWTLVDYPCRQPVGQSDTISAGSPVTLTLSTLEYTCVPDSFVKSIAVDSKSIMLIYRPVYNPRGKCSPWYGTTSTIGYQLMAPAAGKYPVFIESQPSCAPLCKMASTIECIDTLVVEGSAAIKGQAGHFINGTAPLVRKNNGSLVFYNAERLKRYECAITGRQWASP